MIEDQGDLGGPADREGVNSAHPRLAAREGERVLRRRVVQAVNQLADVAQFAPKHEVDEGDLPSVEVGEVDAGAEGTSAAVARVGQDAAAQHAHGDRVVEEREVDGRLQGLDHGVVLGVEDRLVADGHLGHGAIAAYQCLAEVQAPRAVELRQQRQRARCGRQHRLHEVLAGVAPVEQVRKEDPLVDLPARLRGLGQRAVDGVLGPGRDQAGDGLGGGERQLVDTHVAAAAVGQLVVDVLGVPGQVRVAGLPGRLLGALGHGPLGRRAFGPRGHGRDQPVAVLQMGDQQAGVHHGFPAERWRRGRRGVPGAARPGRCGRSGRHGCVHAGWSPRRCRRGGALAARGVRRQRPLSPRCTIAANSSPKTS